MRAFRRTAVSALALSAFALPLVAPVVSAQAVDAAPRTKHRTPRRLVYSLVGIGVGTGLASLYWSIGKDSPGGTCTSRACVGTAMIGGGALVGFMVGREFDQLHRMRYRGGAPLTPSSVTAALAGEPLLLAVRDSVVAVAGTAGIQLFTSGGDLKAGARRGTGIRGIEALDIAPGAHALAVGAQTGVYLYPPGGGLGLLLREGRASALATGRDRVWFAVGNRVESAPITADTSRGWPGLDVGRHVDMLLVDDARGVVWALADSSLLALRAVGDSLEQVGRLDIGAPTRRLSLQGDRMAVALGEGGVRLLDVHDPAAPREVAAWRGTRYAYDVSLAGNRLYVAAGVDGLYVLGTAGDSLTTLGLARELGFASALQSVNGYTYLIDRSTNLLRRISSGF